MTQAQTESLQKRAELTPEELAIYQGGFKVAINFLYHHQANQDAMDAFRQYLNQHMPPEVVQEAINMVSPAINPQTGENCPAGKCPTPSGCVLCLFEFAFDGSYFTGV